MVMCVCGHHHKGRKCRAKACGCMSFEVCPDLNKFDWGCPYWVRDDYVSHNVSVPYPIGFGLYGKTGGEYPKDFYRPAKYI